jgi:hypothetical protein
MEKYRGFRLFEPDLETTSMQKEVIEKLQDTREALAMLESQTVMGHLKSWLAVSSLLRLNPHSILLRNLMSEYDLTLQRLPAKDFREFWCKAYPFLSKQELHLWGMPISDDVSSGDHVRPKGKSLRDGDYRRSGRP